MGRGVLKFFALFILAFLFGLPGGLAGEQLKVTATIFPLYDFARAIGGDRVAVTLLLPPGVEAHTFEPRPRDIVSLNRADVFLYTGSAMEPW
ncbi:MAG: zinc ABC transporter substrate-binding protein, partial [Candidatus Omnitrophica bacterium]|nr:zinc ABC transporter substrate-binding protein [Candidatus Omnitrophota bacterium]